MNKQRIKIFFLVFIIVFLCLVTSACGEDPAPSKPTLSILSINNKYGSYDKSTTTSFSNGSTVVVNLGIKTTGDVDMCGYQIALQYDKTKMQFLPTQYNDLLNTFSVTAAQDSQNSNCIRIIAVPKTKNGSETIAKNATTAIMQVCFQAIDTGSNIEFSIVNQPDFASTLSVYDSKKDPINLVGLTLDKPVKINVR